MTDDSANAFRAQIILFLAQRVSRNARHHVSGMSHVQPDLCGQEYDWNSSEVLQQAVQQKKPEGKEKEAQRRQLGLEQACGACQDQLGVDDQAAATRQPACGGRTYSRHVYGLIPGQVHVDQLGGQLGGRIR